MAYTEPTLLAGMVRSTILSHPGLMSRITLVPNGTRTAPNKIAVPVVQRPSTAVQTITGALLTPDEDNLIQTLTCADKGDRISWPASLYNTVKTDPGRIPLLTEAYTDHLRIAMEVALHALLDTGTVTGSLATDNTFTIAEFMAGVASILSYGADITDLTFVTGVAGFASLVTNGLANAGGTLVNGNRINGMVGLFQGSPIPIIVSQNVTISGATSGTAGHLFARQGVIGAITDVNVSGPAEFGPAGNTIEMAFNAAYAFGFTEGTGGTLTYKFINP